MAHTSEHIAEVTKRLKTSSAVVPTLIYDAIVLPSGVAGLLIAPERLSLFFEISIASAVVLTVSQIALFSLFDRDRLQNEDHIERKMILQQIRPQIGDASTTIDIVEGSPISNPLLLDGESRD